MNFYCSLFREVVHKKNNSSQQKCLFNINFIVQISAIDGVLQFFSGIFFITLHATMDLFEMFLRHHNPSLQIENARIIY